MINAKTKYFGKSQVVLDLPNLLTIQKDNWKKFWDEDLKELLTEISPIRDYSGKELELWFLDYKVGESKYKDDFEAKNNNDSYEAPLRVKVRLVNLKTKEIKEQEVFLTDFPVMTERGTFIVNGVERVAISQLIRSPGVFFTMQGSGGKNHFGAKIIPNRGSWLEFETEPSGFIGVKIDRKRKVSAVCLLRALGAAEGNQSIKEYFADVNNGEVDFIEETLKRDPVNNQSDALIEIYQRLRPGDIATPDTAKELIWNMFFNFERYDLSKVGRWRMANRLSEQMTMGNKVDSKKSKKKNNNDESAVYGEIKLGDRILKLEDIIATIREIIRLNNDPNSRPDEIDHLGNRRVRVINELVQSRLRAGLVRMARILKDRMSTLDLSVLTPAQLINPRPVMAVVKEFFTSSQICQFMDNENPLAEVEHKRRLSATGPGGLARERAGFEVRDVQASHYGRICPIQTPEGPNIGLVGHLASFAKINPYGFIETPYFKVQNGKVTSEINYLNAYEEEKYNIAPGSVRIGEKGTMLDEQVEARIKSEPGLINKNTINRRNNIYK
ncbi:MAG: DNA-directed RNA polymerase subunit beta [Parcubacteria group bacterium GW2011_GWC1_38_6]|nr:MAG: DNA-directed RNA polymerase subunit beta [Parcubacteria group bacterium GW2011_GWC1_38_6]